MVGYIVQAKLCRQGISVDHLDVTQEASLLLLRERKHAWQGRCISRASAGALQLPEQILAASR